MKFIPISIEKSLNPAYLTQSLKRSDIERFKKCLLSFFDKFNINGSEEHQKFILNEFLSDAFYKLTNAVNSSNNIDSAIYSDIHSDSSKPLVLIEAKRTTNSNEMITADNPYAKSFYEITKYYFEEKKKGNNEIKFLIITNFYDFFIFNAAEFERVIGNNKDITTAFDKWKNKQLINSTSEYFYNEVIPDILRNSKDDLTVCYFDIRDYKGFAENSDQKDDDKLINLYKVFSPTHLLKKRLYNDSNTLNTEFYNELLYIFGLEEVKENGKKLIQRKPNDHRFEASILENTINILEVRQKLDNLEDLSSFGENYDEQVFSVALELCIIWLNRILFLKLLEGQLMKYFKNISSTFLNQERINDFDELNELFFEVMAVPISNRSLSVFEKFGHIPYLNSSLFEESDIEKRTVVISDLKDRLTIEIYPHSV